MRQTSRRSKSVEPRADTVVAMLAASQDDEPETQEEHNLEGDYGNIALLFLLYVLQGLPMGLSAALPMILKENDVSTSDLGTFSVSAMPFSVKLLWAPIVDAVFVQSIGRRKTWLVPCQLIIGAILIFAPIQELVETKQIKSLTMIFMSLFFLCATQDIAVDGWALTLLQKRNVGYASTCNSAGQSLGFFLSLTGYLALNSFEIVELGQWCFMCGVLFVTVTLAVWAFKHEDEDHETHDIWVTYRLLFKIAHVAPVRKMVMLLMLLPCPFAICGIASLKLQENKFPKEHLAAISTVGAVFSILTPLAIAKHVNGDKPFRVARLVYVPRVLQVFPIVAIIYTSHIMQGDFTTWFYAAVVGLTLMEHILMTSMFSSKLALFARVSDPKIGGTYMTFLNTMSNLGNLWVNTAALKVVDSLAYEGVDGFYVLAGLSSFFGVVWYVLIGARLFKELDEAPLESWLVSEKKSSE